MKIKLNSIVNQAASALMVTLFIITLLALSVGGYLTYVEQQTLLGARSQSWNLALGLSEAGIEEGIQHCNQNYLNMSTDTWVASGNTYTLNRTFTNGNRYTVDIDFANPNRPVITSQAYVSAPTFAQNAPPAFFAAAGVNPGNGDPRSANRNVRIEATRSSMILGSMVAKHKIDLKGNGITSDSYDSGDPAKSTNGQYDPAKAGDMGDIASNDSIVSSVSVQNANIYGHVSTGPGGTATIGSNGGVGSHAWQAGNDGFQSGWVMDNANFTFPDIKLPYTTGTAPMSGDVVTINSVVTNSSTFVTSTYPSPPASGYLGPITTNSTTTTTSVYPGSGFAGLLTNTTYVTSVTKPSGSPPGLTTNYTTTSVTSTTYPAAGTYVGSVTTTIITKGDSKDRGTFYTYNQITGISGYTYAVVTFQYPSYTYTYTVYLTTPTFSTNHYDNVVQNGDYYVNSLPGKTVVTGKARLVLADGLHMNGTDQIIIAPGGSLEVYCAGTSVTIGGNGVMNQTGYAGDFLVYCTPSVTSLTFNGNGEFSGVLIAPNAQMTMNGGGNSIQDFKGAVMASSVDMNGHFNFHYDERLGRLPGKGRFLITSWTEVKL